MQLALLLLIAAVPATAPAQQLFGQPACAQKTFLGENDGPGARFGAAIAIDGDVLAIADTDEAFGASDAGAVHLFRRAESGAWLPDGTVSADPLAETQRFGSSLALSKSTLMVGVDNDGPGLLADPPGRVVVFEHGDGWNAQQVLTPSAGADGDHFGASIAIEGDLCVIGAPRADVPTADAGAAYVFERIGGLWVETDQLLNPSVVSFDHFGASVDISGETIIVGAPDDDGQGESSGTATIFRRDDGQWVVESHLSNAFGGPNEQFGAAVAIDGDRAVVGVPGYVLIPPSEGRGRICVYRRTDDGTWVKILCTLPTYDNPGAQFGISVAIEGDIIAVGSPGSSAPGSDGVAQVYELGGSGWQTISITGSSGAPELAATGAVGSAVALDGPRLMVADPLADQVDDLDGGAVFLWELLPEQSLTGCPATLSVASGGAHALTIDLGPDHTAELYLVLGSLSGTTPGLVVDGVEIPVVFDAYTAATLGAPNLPPLSNSFGVLDGDGAAAAEFSLPVGSDPTLAGLNLTHAAIAIGVDPGLAVVGATESATLALVP